MGYDEEITEWVVTQLGMSGSFGDCATMGFVKDGKLIGGIVFHDFRRPSMEVSLATISKHWCNRRILRTCFSYPFNQMKVKRLTAMVWEGNTKSIKLIEGLGFKKEGYLREGLPLGNAYIYGMLKDECKWI